MVCPRCGHKYVCPCNSCKERTRGRIRWKYIAPDVEACGVCGLAAHVDTWFDEEYMQLASDRRDWPKPHIVSSKRWWRIPMRERRATTVL